MPASRCIASSTSALWNAIALQRGARDVGRGRAAGEPDDRAARVGIPVRRAEPGEGRHEVHAAGSRGTVAASASTSARLSMMPSPSRSHCTTAPADEDAALQRVVTSASSCQATVVSSRLPDATARRPVFISRKQPVP